MRIVAAVLAIACFGCATAPDRSVESVAEMANGKRVYVLHCARCHGPDGKDEKYPFIARLDGIGQRMTPAEILEATWATGLVSRDSLTPEEQRCLGLYVATL